MPQTKQIHGAKLVPNLVYYDADEAMRWLEQAFGFTVLLRVEGAGGRIDPAQLVRDDIMIMLSSVRTDEFGSHFDTPKAQGFSSQGAYLIVDDVAGAYERALAAGAEVVIAMKEQDYGGEGFTVRDPEGHIWSFGDYNPWRAAEE